MILTAAAGATDSLVAAMGTAATSIQGVVNSAVEVALPVAATILAITIGWRLFRNFTRG